MSGDQNNQNNQQNQQKQKGGGGNNAQRGITLSQNYSAGNDFKTTLRDGACNAVGFLAAVVVAAVAQEALKTVFPSWFGDSGKPALPSPGQAAHALSTGDPNQIKALISRNPKLLEAAREAVAQQEQQAGGGQAPVQEAVTQPVNTPPAQADQPKPDNQQPAKGDSGKGNKNK